MTSFPSGPRFLLLRDHSGSSKRQGPYNHSLWPFDEKSVFYHSNTLGASSLTPWILNGGLDGKGGGGRWEAVDSHGMPEALQLPTA